jgi:hypothetical protein
MSYRLYTIARDTDFISHTSVDGWKSFTKDSVNGICVNVDFKVRDLINPSIHSTDVYILVFHSRAC